MRFRRRDRTRNRDAAVPGMWRGRLESCWIFSLPSAGNDRQTVVASASERQSLTIRCFPRRLGCVRLVRGIRVKRSVRLGVDATWAETVGLALVDAQDRQEQRHENRPDDDTREPEHLDAAE